MPDSVQHHDPAFGNQLKVQPYVCARNFINSTPNSIITVDSPYNTAPIIRHASNMGSFGNIRYTSTDGNIANNISSVIAIANWNIDLPRFGGSALL